MSDNPARLLIVIRLDSWDEAEAELERLKAEYGDRYIRSEIDGSED